MVITNVLFITYEEGSLEM